MLGSNKMQRIVFITGVLSKIRHSRGEIWKRKVRILIGYDLFRNQIVDGAILPSRMINLMPAQIETARAYFCNFVKLIRTELGRCNSLI